MLGWALIFLLLAVTAGVLGFAVLAGVAAIIARIFFLIFLALLVIHFVSRLFRGDSSSEGPQ